MSIALSFAEFEHLLAMSSFAGLNARYNTSMEEHEFKKLIERASQPLPSGSGKQSRSDGYKSVQSSSRKTEGTSGSPRDVIRPDSASSETKNPQQS